VGDVEPKGPAAKAGVKSGDVVLEFNGKAVRDSRQLKLQVAQTKPGLTVPVKVLREGSTRTLEVTLKELPGSDKIARAERPQAQDTGTLNGVGVADLDRRTRAELDVPAHVNGAVVTEVEPDSAAHEAGLQPGDVILEINRQPVRNAQQAVQLTENPKDKTTLLRIWSKGASHYLVVDETKAG
jgi:serine protease Do